ncbi:G-protein coupled receptor 4 [Anabarilius grahami]|uniref:G-protein coupled receptor 4 n=1 Tax=Anabarilius grahami TaxID=495550 RepID=A0A3N0XSN9_ANAGA|nr:G-protein coupled receptor 4 [Anabarilius grahami]
MNISKESATLLTHEECNITAQPEHKFPTGDIAMYAISVLFGLPTHSYVLWLIATGAGRGIASEIFILNVSVCEIVFCLRSLICALANDFPKLWEIVMFLTGIVITGRFFQCLICVERYLAVVHPVTFLKYKPLRYKVACSIVTWIANLISCVFCMRFINPCFKYHFAYFYLSQFSVYLSINLFCCLAVLRALKQPGPGERGGEKNMKGRAFYVILTTTVTLLIIYVPSIFMSLRYLLSIPSFPGLDSLSLICYLIAGFVQPLHFIYRVGKLPLCKCN